MENYTKNYTAEVDEKSIVNKVMTNVFMLMALALIVTGGASFYILQNQELLLRIVSSQGLLFGLMGAELLLVIVLSMAINKISANVAMIMFAVYSILTGVTLSPILFMYTEESVATTFFITAATFGAMALIGYTTKKDLSTMGRVLLMALIGLIIASIANIFIGSSGMGLIINYAGVLIFVGLTAYDTQKIKVLIQNSIARDGAALVPKIAIIGALELYLDFINLFIKLLSIMGKRK
ncbi:MAG: Bax inhibitor-1/YccA family protein [Bacteroidaceae bacterium]|nr:Bax inhibitor-1/YccA family protein [Bacteroidaceae bacterium]